MTTVPLTTLLLISAFAGLLVWAAVNDFISRTIPNRVSIAITALYPAFVASAPVADWAGGALVGGVVLGGGFALFALRVIGGGDAKLAAAVALWAGPELIADFLFTMILAGGVLALFLVSRFRLGAALACGRMGAQGAEKTLLHGTLPYGPAIAMGGLVVALARSGII